MIFYLWFIGYSQIDHGEIGLHIFFFHTKITYLSLKAKSIKLSSGVF